VNVGDYDRRTALHLAGAEGNLPVVRLLVKHKANPEAKDRWNQSPIDSARDGNYEKVVKFLLSIASTPGASSSSDKSVNRRSS